MPLVWNKPGWNELVKEVIDLQGKAMMERVAKACNDSLPADAPTPEPGKEHYMAGTEGEGHLTRDSYRATAIAVTAYAMRDNAKNNTLIRMMPSAAE